MFREVNPKAILQMSIVDTETGRKLIEKAI